MMGFFDTQDTHVALANLLDRERTAILNGKYDQLEQFAVEKERLLNELTKVSTDKAVLAQLREQTERNGILYDAMRAGIGSALERLRALREPQPTMRTYDESGRSSNIEPVKDTPVRRA